MDLWARNGILCDVLPLESAPRRIVIDVGAGNILWLAPRQLQSSTVSAENVDVRAIVTKERDKQGDYLHIRLVDNVGSRVEESPLGNALCFVDVPEDAQVEVRVAEGGRRGEVAALQVHGLTVDLEMETGTSAHLGQGGAVRVSDI